MVHSVLYRQTGVGGFEKTIILACMTGYQKPNHHHLDQTPYAARMGYGMPLVLTMVDGEFRETRRRLSRHYVLDYGVHVIFTLRT